MRFRPAREKKMRRIPRDETVLPRSNPIGQPALSAQIEQDWKSFLPPFQCRKSPENQNRFHSIARRQNQGAVSHFPRQSSRSFPRFLATSIQAKAQARKAQPASRAKRQDFLPRQTPRAQDCIGNKAIFVCMKRKSPVRREPERAFPRDFRS